MLNSRNTFFSRALLLSICIFIALDFARIAGFIALYETGVYIISFITIISFLVSCKKILKKNDKFFLLAIVFYLVLILVEIINNGFNNLFMLLEHTIWIILPLCYLINTETKSSIIYIGFVFATFNALLAFPSVLLHVVDLPGATVAGAIGRDSGYYGNPNINGMINAINILILLWIWKNNKCNRLFCLFAFSNLIISSVSLLLSGCRSAILAILIIILFFVISKIKNVFVKIVVSGGVISGLLVIFARYFKMGINESSIYSFLYTITSRRSGIWIESFKMIKGHYLFGRGFDSLKEVSVEVLGKNNEILKGSGINNLHNLFMNILYHSGILTLILFICMIIYYLLIILKSKTNDFFAVSIVFCGFVISMLDVPLLYSTCAINIIWWLFVYYSVECTKD